LTSRRERVKDLIAQKEEIEKKIDGIWKEYDELKKKREKEREVMRIAAEKNPTAFSAASATLESFADIGRISDIDGLRRKVARINDELMVNLLDSIDSHSNKLEWLAYPLIFTSAVLILLTSYQTWRVLG
jgi:hypothetical protein